MSSSPSLFSFIIHISVWWQVVCRRLLFCYFFTFVAQSMANKIWHILHFKFRLLLSYSSIHLSLHCVSYLTFCFTSLVYGLIVSCFGPQATAEGFMTSALVSASQKINYCLSEDPIWTGSFLYQINLAQGFVYHSHFSCRLEANFTLFNPLEIISSVLPRQSHFEVWELLRKQAAVSAPD